MTGNGIMEKPSGAWTSQETVLYMVRFVLHLAQSSPNTDTTTTLYAPRHSHPMSSH